MVAGRRDCGGGVPVGGDLGGGAAGRHLVGGRRLGAWSAAGQLVPGVLGRPLRLVICHRCLPSTRPCASCLPERGPFSLSARIANPAARHRPPPFVGTTRGFAGTVAAMPGALPDGEPVPADGTLPESARGGLGKRPFGIYVHVPFCATRCGYCDFNTYTAAELGGRARRRCRPAPIRTSRSRRSASRARSLGDADLPVSTVFFGGGTPTLLPPGRARRHPAGHRRRVRPGARGRGDGRGQPGKRRRGQRWASCGLRGSPAFRSACKARCLACSRSWTAFTSPGARRVAPRGPARPGSSTSAWT